MAFLVAARLARRRPDVDHPYGHHRAVGVGHLVAAVSLTTVGGYLIVDSALKLLTAEHPSIGAVQLFGGTFWLGWLMIGALSLTIVPPVLLGRTKMKLAEQLHDKVLYADADMNKADWMTAVVGILGIGVGLWWLDAVAALFISQSIVRDGIRNLRGAVRDLMDARATTYDGGSPHPLLFRVDRYLAELPWVEAAGSRARDEGHVFHIESFVVPRRRMPSLEQLEEARRECIALDWKVQDLVIVPTAQLPEEVVRTGREHRGLLDRFGV